MILSPLGKINLLTYNNFKQHLAAVARKLNITADDHLATILFRINSFKDSSLKKGLR